MPRSNKVAREYIPLVKHTLKDCGFPSQRSLAESMGISRSTTDKFFNGKPVDFAYFIEISERLGLDWQKIAAPELDLPRPIIPQKGSWQDQGFPDGSVPLNSPFYIERPSIEFDCYKEFLQPGALIRIKAPRQMGKTSLLNRILAQGNRQEYRTACLNLQEAEAEVFSNLDRFLRWFCANVSLQLKIPDLLSHYWNASLIGSMISCKNYFQAYLLPKINSPLILGLDEVDQVFQYPEIAQHFFPMLRSWHEVANTSEIWKQLRLVVVHSTEDYGRLDINQSPFNVGLPIELQEFTPQQVTDLAQSYQLNWNARQVKALMSLVGGHPYLIRLALYHIAHDDVTLEALLQDAVTDTGIYKSYLRRHLATLKECSELAQAFQMVVTASEPVQINPLQGYKLYSMGLTKRQGDYVIPRCKLYQQYFQGIQLASI